MAVDSTNAEYSNRLPDWKKLRDVIAGEDAVKDQATAYLPRLGGQDDKQYAAYKMRASFYNATGRTVEGLSGMVFRKSPQVEVPEAMADMMKDVTLSGVQLHAFAEQIVEEVLAAGRAGALVDYPRVRDRGLTRAQAERMNLRPFWIGYKPEDILDWRVGLVGNKTILTQVRLFEKISEEGEKEFEEVQVEQIRVLELVDGTTPDDEPTGEMQYQQRLFRKNSKTGEWEETDDTIVPMMAGRPLNFIPFVFFGVRDTTPQVSKPPLLDLANINLSHYRTNADLEHGAHFTALPTPYCFGIREDEAPDQIGPETVWTGTQKDVSVGMLEYTGKGLDALEKRREVKEAQMAALGARMLEAPKKAAEAADTARIHRTGEISVLASIAMSVAAGLTRLTAISRDWMGLQGDVAVRLNTDFMPTPMDPQMLTALFQLVQGGRISQQTFFENLQRGEIIAADTTFDQDELDRANDALAELDSEDPLESEAGNT